jgi:hypothetical protein
MFPGSPSPLRPETTLVAIARLAVAGRSIGVWIGGCRRSRRLRVPGAGSLLLSTDLGRLLRLCDHVIVRDGRRPRLVAASALIQCRVLEVVLGTPFLPAADQLRRLFPSARRAGRGVSIPIGLGSAEEALALLAVERVPVVGSRIGYRGHSG